ncbi:MAG: class I mannose-6-phosphate isomerase [Tannerella sp.]|jgi:mannose-6-phosphate isomerase|nr:class I mannose-6-phosphate isomerase [Tannerella sp.]
MLYPLIFKPIFKEIIWGGTDILPFKGLPADTRKIGESWELSHVEGNYSEVANGSLTGKTIDELAEEYGARLLGKQVFERSGKTFPLLIKFIDARDNLSIQVHPDDALAAKRHNSFGKTEMWYVVKASPEAALYSGFSQQISPEEYVRRVEDNTITDVLKKYNVQAGDVFFLPAGRVHAIGSGCFIAEIQQTSNITYRIYDYNRKDANGKNRELHTDLAKDAIDYTLYPDYKTSYIPVSDEAITLVECKYFTNNILDLTNAMRRDFSSIDSFVIYMCLEGKAVIKDNKDNELSVYQGQTVLIPAETKTIEIEPSPTTKMLETFIN